MTAALIARLEGLTGPSREVDVEIGKWARSVGMEAPAIVPMTYTSSIDAALTLVPKGFHAVSASINENGPSSMRIGHPYVFGNGARCLTHDFEARFSLYMAEIANLAQTYDAATQEKK